MALTVPRLQVALLDGGPGRLGSGMERDEAVHIGLWNAVEVD